VGALKLGRGKTNKPWTGVEAVTARRLQHPCVVRTFKHTAVLIQVLQCTGFRMSLLEALRLALPFILMLRVAHVACLHR